nr:hypothetical protein [Chelativorans petroleitrophicus]
MHELDLSGCDREPIHIPGSIQPHGLLLVTDASTLKVLHVAGDVEGRLGVTDWQNAPLEALLGEDAASAALTADVTFLRHVVPPLADEAFDISITRGDSECLIELEPAASPQLATRCCRGLKRQLRASIGLPEWPNLWRRPRRRFAISPGSTG